MIRLAVSVEGRTEEEFVKQLLQPHLQPFGVFPTPVLLGRASGVHGGGNVTVDRLLRDMLILSNSFDAVTSLVDHYGFRRRGTRSTDELILDIEERIRRRTRGNVRGERVFPYVQRHEFESLLFSDVNRFRLEITLSESALQVLRRARDECLTPEEIDDGPETSPSRRICAVATSYDKVVHGPAIAARIGLEVIRRECPRFAGWLARLEGLAGGTHPR